MLHCSTFSMCNQQFHWSANYWPYIWLNQLLWKGRPTYFMSDIVMLSFSLTYLPTYSPNSYLLSKDYVNWSLFGCLHCSHFLSFRSGTTSKEIKFKSMRQDFQKHKHRPKRVSVCIDCTWDQITSKLRIKIREGKIIIF